MSETRKLYYEDVYIKEFTAKVLECREAGKGYEIVLDQTAFYPEGGGQPCDLGTLNGIAVTDVQEKDGEIVHYTEAALEAGSEVESIYKPIHQKEGNEIRLMDKLEEKEHREEKILDHMLLQQLLGTLEKEERTLIYMRYFQDKTQSQVGKELGISQVQVSRMEKKIMENLRKIGT